MGYGNEHKTKTIAKNTIVLFMRMLVLTIVNLYSVKLVLNGLGIVDYGLYNAIAALVTSSTCISSTLALSTQRYYSFAIGKGDHRKFQQTFSASLLLTVLLALTIMILFSIIGPWFIYNYMTIPASRLTSAINVFFLSLASFMIVLIQIPYLAAIFANEDMGVYALVSTIDSLLKLMLAYSISHATADRLVFYGIGLVIIALLTLTCYVFFATRNYQGCRCCKIENRSLMKELALFSGWTFYGTLASVVTTHGSALTLNVFFGPVSNAAFSIGNQVYNAMNSLSGSTVVAFRPAMIKSFARNDYNYLGRLFVSGNKLIYYLLLLLAIPLLADTDNVLAVWLGKNNVNVEMTSFTRLYIIYTILLSLHNPITTIVQATAKIRNYTLVVDSVMLAGLPLAILLFLDGKPSFWIMLSLIIACFIAHICRLFFLCRLYKEFRLGGYINKFVIPAIATTAISCIITIYISKVLPITNHLMHLVVVTFIATVATLFCIFTFVLTKGEKQKAFSFFVNRIMRK